MKKTLLAIKELRNWFFIKKIIKQEKSKSDSLWNRYNLRYNWYGRIYTVISLREEDMGEEEIVKRWKAMEYMRPINEYLVQLGFMEIIFPSIEEIPNSRSYLIVYSPIIENLTFKFVFRRILFLILISSITYLYFKFR